MLPAGLQFTAALEREPWGLPTTSTWATLNTVGAAVAGGQVTAILGSRGRQVRAAIRDAAGAWRDVLVDPGTGVRGPGVYTNADQLGGNGVAAGAKGLVAIGMETITNPSRYFISRLGFAWFSRDGSTWARIDFRSVLGAGAAFVPRSVATTPTGWLIVGSLTSRDLSAKATIVVLASTDGTHWKTASRLSGKWTTTAAQLWTLGDRLLLVGAEWICSTGGYELNAAIGSPQLRLWSSSDGGRTWTAGDWTAGGVNEVGTPAPTSTRGCTGGTGAYSSSGQLLGVVNGRVVIASADHSRLATSTDLRTWQVGELAGAVPTGGDHASGAARSVVAAADGTGIAILALGGRRDATDAAGGYGSQVVAWRSDDGATWSRLPAARPLEVTPRARLIPSPDGSVYLYDQPAENGPAEYRQSVPGPLITVTGCTAAARADCSFLAVSSVPAGADLSGIDLFGAEVTASADLSGANLSGARLTGAVVDGGANLAGANLSGATLIGASIEQDVHLAGASFRGANLTEAAIRSTDAAAADFSRANLSGTDLAAVDLGSVTLAGSTMNGTRVNPSVFAVDLAGVHVKGLQVSVGATGSGHDLAGHDFGRLNVTGFYFSGDSATTPGDMKGTDFRDAAITGLAFGNVDLTGAKFPPHTGSITDFETHRTGIYFSDGVICPDGKPGTKVSFSLDCRLR